MVVLEKCPKMTDFFFRTRKLDILPKIRNLMKPILYYRVERIRGVARFDLF